MRESVREFSSPDRVHLKTLLTRYKDILVARASLIHRNAELKRQNAEMRKFLQLGQSINNRLQ